MNKRLSAYSEQILDALVHWLGVLKHVEFVHFPVLVESLGQQGSQDLEMADECYSFVGFAIFVEDLLHLPGPFPEFLGGLINDLILDELQELLLLLLKGGISKVLQMDVAGVADMLAEDLNEPQLRVVSHVAEVELGKVLLLFLDVTADVAGEAEDLGEDGMHLHPDVSSPKDLLAGLECPPVRRDEDNVDLLGLEFLAGSSALRLALLGDAAVDILLGVGDLAVEVRQLDAVLPAHVGVQDLLEAQKALVEVRLGVPNRNQVAVFFFSLYLFNHIFYC